MGRSCHEPRPCHQSQRSFSALCSVLQCSSMEASPIHLKSVVSVSEKHSIVSIMPAEPRQESMINDCSAVHLSHAWLAKVNQQRSGGRCSQIYQRCEASVALHMQVLRILTSFCPCLSRSCVCCASCCSNALALV